MQFVTDVIRTESKCVLR